jgi:hypothetical protein
MTRAATLLLALLTTDIVSGQTGPGRDSDAGTGVITGRVVAAATGAPLGRVQIRATADGVPAAHFATTDAQGRFELRGLAAGKWMLAASRSGYVTQHLGQRYAFQVVNPIELADGARFTGANFTLPRGGVITGRIYDEAGEPLAGIRVDALRSQVVDGQRQLSLTRLNDLSDDTGAYRIYGLPPGDYYIVALHPSDTTDGLATQASYAPTYYPGAARSGQAQRVSVGAGIEQADITFQVLPLRAVRVTGRAVTSGGAPLANGLATLADPLDPAGFSPIRGGRVMDDGSFTMINVPPGAYTLHLATGPGPADSEREVAMVPLTVGDEDVSGITVVTGKGATITGTVTVADARTPLPRTGIRVSAHALLGPARLFWEVPVDDRGRFRVNALAGRHRLQVDGLPDGWMVKSLTVNNDDIADVLFELRGTETIDVQVLLTNRIPVVTGRVTSDGRAAPGAAVLLFPEDSAMWTSLARYVRTARGDAQGRFTISGLPGDTRYLAVALDYVDDSEARDPDFLEQMKNLATPFALRDGDRRDLSLGLVVRW